MMKPPLVVFEDDGCRDLHPLTYWRAACELRTGYGSLLDHLRDSNPGVEVVLYCRPELATVVAQRTQLPVNTPPGTGEAILVNSRLLARSPIRTGRAPAVQWHGDDPIVIHADRALLDRLTPAALLARADTRRLLDGVPEHRFIDSPRVIRYPWDLVHANAAMLELGWQRAGRPAEIAGRVCPGAHLLNESAIHVGAHSVVKPGVVLDAENGPIYLGRNVTVCPNVSVEGPCYIGDGSLVQPGSALRDAMSIGPRCKVGGELESSIIHGYANKQHDGFLGHAYVAEWVNLAADTINSDLKNTYGSVRVPINGVEVDSGQTFVGLTVGDHSKTGIGQLFPTGAVVGFGSSVATGGLAPKFVPSFTWMTGPRTGPYEVERCLAVARRVMARRNVEMTAAQEALFRSIAETAARTEVAGSSAP